MQIFFFTIFALIFCFINYKIIISDLKTKKIPNKNLLQLIILLPFWYIFLYFFPFSEVNILGFLVQILISFIISFLLFNFGIWRAGDAKYLLVLSLFIPYIGIIPLIGNLGILTLLYLFLYFLWFFIGKSIFYKGYAKNLFLNIKIDLSEKWKIHKNNKGGKSFQIIFKWFLVFLILFVGLRLTRMYLFSNFFINFGSNETFGNLFEKYHFYIIFLGIGLSFGIYYFIKKIGNIFKSKIPEKYGKNKYLIFTFWLIISFGLLFFIAYEWQIDAEKTKFYLIRIFTIGISLYIFVKIIWYGYKLSFGVAEEQFIDIKNLKEGMVVDKKYLHNMFWEQSSLGAKYKDGDKKKEGYLYISPEKYFLGIKNPIDSETKNSLKNIYNTVNFQNKKNNIVNFQENNQIKIVKTFSFGIYIFVGFLVTFIFGNSIIQFFIKKIIELISF